MGGDVPGAVWRSGWVDMMIDGAGDPVGLEVEKKRMWRANGSV
jgi:hypothetical protein